jgi:mono/diheme cytochrome c family protein
MRRAALLAAAGLLLAACQEKVGPSSPFNVPWSHDMYTQPSLYPQEYPLGSVAGTVSVADDPPPLPHMVAAERLKNPVPMSKASVERGKVLYGYFCVPCHGAGGKGDGPVAPVFVPPPPLDGVAQKGRPDGFIYATIRQGSLSQLMPAYGYRMSEQERWDLVNYVRSLQGVVAHADQPAGVKEAARP